MKIKPIITALLVSVLLLSTHIIVFAAEQKTMEDRRRAISGAIEALSRIKVKAVESDIPAEVKPLFTELKHEILNFISESMNDETLGWKTADDLKAIIIPKLKEVGIKLPNNDADEKQEYSYDEYQDINIEKPPHYENLLVVTTSLWVMCGEDTSFYIFKKEKGKWNLVLAEEANGYDDIRGAHSWFSYSISPPDKNGRFYVVTANINPWCSSNWQGLRYTVYRPGQTAHNPQVLLKNKSIIYLGVDLPVFKIQTKTDRFKLEFRGEWYATPGTGASHQYVIYGVAKEKVKLIKKGRLNKSVHTDWR